MTTQRAFLLAGLGNPTHLSTRHSVGFSLVDRLAQEWGLGNPGGAWKLNKVFPGDLAQVTSPGSGAKVQLLKPRIPMNLNGRAVARAAKSLGIPITQIIVLHDDLERALGKVSYKASGSANGHNGVRSCIDSLGSQGFARIRIGIGRPKQDEDTDIAKYVLGRWRKEEEMMIEGGIFEQVQRLLFKHYGL